MSEDSNLSRPQTFDAMWALLWPASWRAALVAVPVFFGAGALWNFSLDQYTMFGGGLACCWLAWLVGRHGIFGASHDAPKAFADGREVEFTPNRAPRALAPVLVLVGVGLMVATTPTGVGELLYGPAQGAVWAYELVGKTLEIVLFACWTAVALGCLGYGLVRGDGMVFGAGALLVCVFAMTMGLLWLLYVVGLVEEEFLLQQWHDATEPIRVVSGIFG